MKFNDLKNYYPTLNEALKDSRRKSLFVSKQNKLLELKEKLFDVYDVEDIYIIDDFFDKSIFSINKLPIYCEMSQQSFDAFVEQKEIYGLIEDFSLYIHTPNHLFYLKNELWNTTSDKINKKEVYNETFNISS